MQSTVLFRMVCRLLIVSLFAMPFSPAMAGMIATDEALTAASVQTNRASVLEALTRTDVATQLQSLGVDPSAAKARVASMTDQEVMALSGRINSLPAGANSTGGWVAAIVIVALIWYFYK
jgi:uncharacterized protein YabE (DUF348 family)